MEFRRIFLCLHPIFHDTHLHIYRTPTFMGLYNTILHIVYGLGKRLARSSTSIDIRVNNVPKGCKRYIALIT